MIAMMARPVTMATPHLVMGAPQTAKSKPALTVPMHPQPVPPNVVILCKPVMKNVMMAILNWKAVTMVKPLVRFVMPFVVKKPERSDFVVIL